jgi:hypothetical protein
MVESDRNSDEAKALEKRGITPVFVPDDDPDHKDTRSSKKATDDDEPATLFS